MSFEAEVVPLFIGGCIAVLLAELAAGAYLLRGKSRAGRFFISHTLSMAIGLFFLTRCLFGDRLGWTGGIASIDHSVSIGLFGLFWMFSVFFLLAVFASARPKADR